MSKLVMVLTLAFHRHIPIWSHIKEVSSSLTNKYIRYMASDSILCQLYLYLSEIKTDLEIERAWQYWPNQAFIVFDRISSIFNNLNLFITLAKNNKLSIRATFSPRHLLAPIPKGMFLFVCFTIIIQIYWIQMYFQFWDFLFHLS